jgi:hypothetical protein
MTTPLLRPGRLRAVLRQFGRAIPRAVPWRRAAASGVPPTRFARNGPVSIAYDVRGHGRPLVLIQGVGVGRWGWEPVSDRLARRFRVITVDNRGVGASDTTPGHLLYWEQPRRFARVVCRFLSGPPPPAREPTPAVRRAS